MNNEELLDEAKKARKMSYSPYSHFQVGAALLTESGKIYYGCNIENAGYSSTNCAERTAFFKAVSEGETHFKKIAIVGGKENETPDTPCMPCGVCRQVMMEFCDPKTFQIVIEDKKEGYKIFTLEELLPFGFGPENLQ